MKYPFYENQSMPDRLLKDPTKFRDKNDLLQRLTKAQQNKQSIFAYCKLTDQKSLEMELEFLENSNVIGYIPLEEISYDKPHIGRGNEHIGSIVGVKILDIEDEEDGIIKVKCSRKEHGKEMYEKATADAKKGLLKENMIVKGIIDGIEIDKAYVDLGFGDRMAILGVADIARAYVRDPKDVLKKGQIVDLVIKKMYVDPLNISLSRAMLMDGWESIDKKYRAGTIVMGTVKNRMATGLFIALDESYEGLAEDIPLELNLKYGDKVKVSILNIDKKRQKIKLKLIANM